MKKTVIIAVIITILVIIITGLVLVVTGVVPLNQNSPTEQTVDQPEKATESAPPTPIYILLDPPFTVSFTDEEDAQFLQVSLSLTTNDEETEKIIKLHDPVIRNALVMLLSSQKAADLKSRDGKEKLRQKALEEVKRVLSESSGKEGVNDILFTSFLIQ